MNEMANSMMQKFWDSALALEPPDDTDSHSEMSTTLMNSEATEGKYSSLSLGSSFSFKFTDLKGNVHRFNFATESLDELVTAVAQRIGASENASRPQLLYEDDESDKVLLTCDADLIGAVLHARSLGQKVLRLYLELPEPVKQRDLEDGTDVVVDNVERSGWTLRHSGVLVGAALVAGIAVVVYLRRTNSVSQS